MQKRMADTSEFKTEAVRLLEQSGKLVVEIARAEKRGRYPFS